MNNRIWFYELNNSLEEKNLSSSNFQSYKFLYDKEYLGNISSACLNAEYVSVLFDKRIYLHQVKKSRYFTILNNGIII